MPHKKTVPDSTRIVFSYLVCGLCWNLFFVLLLDLTIKNKLLHSLLLIGEVWIFIGCSALILHKYLHSKSLSLRESEELFQATFEQAAVGIAHLAVDGAWLRVNRKLCEILGYSAEELMTRTVQEITHPEDLDSDLVNIKKVLANQIETYAMDKRYVRKDNSLVWIHLTVSLVRDTKAVPKYFIAVLEDISNRKRSENELNRYKEHLEELVEERTQELSTVVERFRVYFENSLAAMLIMAPDGTVLEANPEVCRLFYMTVEDICGLNVDGLADEYGGRFREAIETCAATGMYRGELIFRRKDGTKFPADVSAAVFRDSSGLEKTSLVVRDISEMKRTEEALRASEAQLKEAQQIAHIGHWELNFETDQLTWSDEIYNIYEVDPDQFKISFDPFFKLLSADEKEKVSRTYSESEQIDTPYDIVNKFNFPGGRIKYIHETTQNFYDQSGKLVRLVGTIQDVTSRWVIEEQLRQLSRVVEQSPVCVEITDLDGCITYVNPKFSELTGYGSEEVLGQNSRILKSGVTPQETYQSLWKAILSGEEWRGELCNRKKNGELYWEMAYVAPVVNSQGETTHYVAVKEDITARKRAEEQLRELSLSDELTGLTNRRGFMLLAKQQIKVSDRSRKGLVLIFADLDQMKSINDTYGHHAGDQALKDTAAILRRSLRASDVIARLGGDEFVALSVETTEKVEALIMGRLRENILAHNLESGRPYELSISFGITIYNPDQPCTLEELLGRGDQLMYDQKKKRNERKRE